MTPNRISLWKANNIYGHFCRHNFRRQHFYTLELRHFSLVSHQFFVDANLMSFMHVCLLGGVNLSIAQKCISFSRMPREHNGIRIKIYECTRKVRATDFRCDFTTVHIRELSVEQFSQRHRREFNCCMFFQKRTTTNRIYLLLNNKVFAYFLQDIFI